MRRSSRREKKSSANLHSGRPFRPGTIPSGQRVIITGLRNHGDLNGTVGRVTEYSEQISRYEIRAGGQLFRVKPDNILPAFEPDEEILCGPDKHVC